MLGRILLIFAILLNSSCARILSTLQGNYSVVEGSLLLPKNVSPEQGDALDFYLLTLRPQPFEERFPLLVLLHSAGQTAEDDLALWEEEASQRRVMLLVPILRRSYGNDPAQLEEFRQLLIHIGKQYPVDKGKVFLAGTSAGALVAQWLFMRYPSLWRGAIFIAAPPEEDLVQISNTPNPPPFFWIHGQKDPQLPYVEVRSLFQKLKQKGIRGELWSDPEAGHEHKAEWHDRIWEWLRETGGLSYKPEDKTE